MNVKRIIELKKNLISYEFNFKANLRFNFYFNHNFKNMRYSFLLHAYSQMMNTGSGVSFIF